MSLFTKDYSSALTFANLPEIFPSVVKIKLRYLLTTLELLVRDIFTELTSLTVIIDTTACQVALQREQVAVVVVVLSQPAPQQGDIQGFVLVGQVQMVQVLVGDQVQQRLELPSNRVGEEGVVLDQSDDLSCPVNQAEITDQRQARTAILNLSAMKLPTVETTVLSSPSKLASGTNMWSAYSPTPLT